MPNHKRIRDKYKSQRMKANHPLKNNKEKLSSDEGWKFNLTDSVLCGQCATQPPYPDWSTIGGNFVIAFYFSMFSIAMIVALFSAFTIVSPFILPTGHNESFGNWAAMVTFVKTLIMFATVALGIMAVFWVVHHETIAIALGIFGVTVVPIAYYFIDAQKIFGGFIQITAIINLVILAIALTISIIVTIWMLFHRLIISYEFNADTGTLRCSDASLLRKTRQHIIPFSSLSSVQIHQHEQYTFTSSARYNKFRGQIKCIDLNGVNYVIGNYSDDLPEKSLRLHEDWLRGIFGDKILQVYYHPVAD